MKNVLDIPRTAMEVLNMLPEGTLCEVIDNVLYMSPSPTTDHQRILLNIAFEIKSFLSRQPLGEVFVAPCDVYINNEENVVEPKEKNDRKAKTRKEKRKGIY